MEVHSLDHYHPVGYGSHSVVLANSPVSHYHALPRCTTSYQLVPVVNQTVYVPVSPPTAYVQARQPPVPVTVDPFLAEQYQPSKCTTDDRLVLHRCRCRSRHLSEDSRLQCDR